MPVEMVSQQTLGVGTRQKNDRKLHHFGWGQGGGGKIHMLSKVVMRLMARDGYDKPGGEVVQGAKEKEN